MTDTFDLGALKLTPGEGRHFDLQVPVAGFELGADSYAVASPVDVRLDISRMTGDGYALHIRFSASLSGPCMRCLGPAAESFDVDAREVSQPGLVPLEDLEEPEPRHVREEFESPYVNRDELLALDAWVHDALALALPAAILCKPDCLGLCAVCGVDLNTAEGHSHEVAPDPRWAGLSDLKFD